MATTPFPSDPLICFAHAAYQLEPELARRNTGLRAFQVSTRDEFEARIGEADVAVASGFWDNRLLEHAPGLRFVQSTSAGMDRFDPGLFRERGIGLASAQGANERAVAEHALALILALARRIPEARDNQARRAWRSMQSNHALREDEIGDKTLVILGLGGIGGRIARLAKAFEMRVIGLRRDPDAGANGADEVRRVSDLAAVLPEADYLLLSFPLTPETRGIVGARELAAMKPGAALINVARGACVVEADLEAALAAGTLGAAALDVTDPEPLRAASPLWAMPNVLITPHTAGETRSYERRVVDILLANIERLRSGEPLLNGVA